MRLEWDSDNRAVVNLEIRHMKERLVRILAMATYWLGIDAIFYFLNRNAKRILTFHSVMPDELCNSGTPIVAESVTSFRRKIRMLKRRWEFSTDINDPRTLTITFDDGFKNEFEVAGMVLMEEGNIPAILFTATSLIGQENPEKSLVVDLLMHWNAGVPDGEYRLEALDTSIKYTRCNRNEVWCKILRPLYAKDGTGMGRNVLNACDVAYPLAKVLEKFSKEYLRLRLCGVSQQDLAAAKQRGWRIGSHSVNHYVFSALNTKRKADELESPGNMKDTVFSYPYGEMQSIDAETIKLAEETGYPGAVSNLPDAGGRASKYFLPRISLPNAPYLIHFELSGVKTFLKTRRLLPVIRI